MAMARAQEIPQTPPQPFQISTDALNERGFFDPRYTCDFDNSSPELRWTDPPSLSHEPCSEFALICEDLDAQGGIFSHWVVYKIPSQLRHLPAGIPPQESLPNGILQGVNGFGKLGYAGPCPPYRDSPHRYLFRLYALGKSLELPVRLQREPLLEALRANNAIIATTEIGGRYGRSLQVQRAQQKAG